MKLRSNIFYHSYSSFAPRRGCERRKFKKLKTRILGTISHNLKLDAMEVYHHPYTELCSKQQQLPSLNHSLSTVRMATIR